VRLTIRRTGGLAGVAVRGQLDTASLGAEAADVEAAVRGLSGGSPAGPPPPDGFRYEISPLDEDSDVEPIVIDEREMPAALKEPVRSALKGGEIEP
jgi:hypothetical protein